MKLKNIHMIDSWISFSNILWDQTRNHLETHSMVDLFNELRDRSWDQLKAQIVDQVREDNL